MRDDVRWYFPGLCGVSERTMWHSGKASATAFLMFPYARRTMLVLRLSQYGVVSDGCVFGLFVPVPWPVLIGFTQEAKISLVVCFGQILFLSVLFVEFHSPNQGTLIPVPPSISPMGLQGLYPASLFLALSARSLTGPYTQWEIVCPMKRLMYPGCVFLEALVYHQLEGCWVLEIPGPFHSCSLNHEIWCSLIFPWIVWCLWHHYMALSSGFREHLPSCFPIHQRWC